MLSQKIREHSALHRMLFCLTEIWNLEPMLMTILHCAGPLSRECISTKPTLSVHLDRGESLTHTEVGARIEQMFRS